MTHSDLTIEMPFGVVDDQNGPLTLSHPEQIFQASCLEEIVPALANAQSIADEGCIVAGFVSYEAGPAFEPALRPAHFSPFPLVYLGAFHRPSPPMPSSDDTNYEVGPWQPEIDRGDYGQAIGVIKEEIASGNAYQVNFTYRLQAEFRGDPFAWYRQMLRAGHGKYSAYLRFGPYSILSASPELFFHWGNGRITTKPMKGTERRGYWREDDEARFTRLSNSVKDRAENLMILDLMRNDVGRIARLGSVRVSEAFQIERLPTVFQMTSTVTGDLASDTTLPDIFAALFPGGSVTGAPKISAMNIIGRLERSPRGVYCGAIGAVFPGRKAIFNIAIRTVTIDRRTGVARMGAGGGITWDSAPQAEFEETRAKTKFAAQIRPKFALLETMRLENGEFFLLERHLNRLARSMDYFEFPWDDSDLRERFSRLAAEHPTGVWRVRATIAESGAIQSGMRPPGSGRTRPKSVHLPTTYRDGQPLSLS